MTLCKGFPLSLRSARKDELATCAALYERVGSAAFTWRPAGYFKASEFLRWAKDEEVYVADVGGEIAGLLSFYRPENFIHCLYVDEDARGLGIGPRLIEHVRGLADGPLSLKVDEPNFPALQFYEHNGWRRAKGEDSEGVDAGVRWLRYYLPL